MSYTMDPENPPKRPVITSLAGALGEVAAWLAANQLDQVRDAEGLTWSVEIKTTQLADPRDAHKVFWQIRVGLSARASGAGLVQAGVLDAVKDERLLGLLGADQIELAMKPLLYRAP